jgi:hypothetical protein
MTDQQREALKAVSDAVVDRFKSMSESQAIGRIQLITARPYDKCIEGLNLMRAEKLIKPGWIEPETDGFLARLVEKNPAIDFLIKKFECTIGKSEVPDFQGFVKPKKVDRLTLECTFRLPEF